jgi:hypothetical protein
MILKIITRNNICITERHLSLKKNKQKLFAETPSYLTYFKQHPKEKVA